MIIESLLRHVDKNAMDKLQKSVELRIHDPQEDRKQLIRTTLRPKITSGRSAFHFFLWHFTLSVAFHSVK